MKDERPNIEREVVKPPAPLANQQGAADGLRGVTARVRRPLPILAVLVLIAALIAGILYLRYAMMYESSDDAFVQAHVGVIIPKMASQASRVYIDYNQHVNKGDLLVELDPQDFEVRLAQASANLAAVVAEHRGADINTRVVQTTSEAGVVEAEASLEAAERQVASAQSQEAEAQAKVAVAEAEATRAAADVERYLRLVRSG